MQKIPLAQAAPGMILGCDIVAAGGQVLALADSEVTPAVLRRLELAGIAKLVVQGKPVPGANMGYDALARSKRLELLFRRYADDKFMTTLKNMLFKHFMLQA